MIESSKGQHEEFEDEEEVATHKGKSREKNRTKHSETEQRRRSKINERFQILRDLIPQNDQKRDKASFLLEVIEYIQFLQDKLNIYERPYQGGWSSEPRKLIPWKNDHVSAEGFTDPSQIIKNGSDIQNNIVLSPSMLHNPQNSLESDMGSAMVYKTLDHLSGSATQSISLNVQETNMFDPIGRHGAPSQPLQESVSDIVHIKPLPHSQLGSWQSGHSTACVNNVPSGQEEKSGSVSISNSFSQGVLDNLTQALQSSGVDLTQASISVQIDVANRTDSRLTSIASSSKDHVSRSLNEQIMSNSQVTSPNDKYEQAYKKLRVEQK